jgi:Spy/CpxP family protein refolding chaperone
MYRRAIAVFTVMVLGAALATSALTATGDGSQRRAGQAGKGFMPLNRFAQTLNLSAQQTEQVRSILVGLREDARQVITSDVTREQKRARVIELRNAAKGSINALLTPDQRQKAEQGRLIDKLLSPKRHMGIRPLLAKLNLSEPQKTRIQAIVRDYSTQIRTVRGDTSLSAEAKRTRVMQIRQDMRTSIMAELTPEQRQQLEQWLAKKRAGAGQRSGVKGRM